MSKFMLWTITTLAALALALAVVHAVEANDRTPTKSKDHTPTKVKPTKVKLTTAAARLSSLVKSKYPRAMKRDGGDSGDRTAVSYSVEVDWNMPTGTTYTTGYYITIFYNADGSIYKVDDNGGEAGYEELLNSPGWSVANVTSTVAGVTPW